MAVPWPIATDDNGLAMGESTFERGQTNATLVYRVPWDEVEEARKVFFGYAYRNGLNLVRVLPQRHPRADWLYATRILEKGEGFTQKEIKPQGAIDAYEDCLFTVNYRVPRYRMNFQPGDEGLEYKRFVERKPKPYVDFVQQDGAAWIFDTADGAPSAKTLKGSNITLRIGKVAKQWIWRDVPEAWIFEPDTDLIATNIEASIGTINSATFAGHAAGTLYLDSVDFDDIEFPLKPIDLQIKNALIDPPRMWDVTLNFIYFSHGWQRLPYIQSSNPVQWYRVKRETGGGFQYDTTDFTDIFAAV